jgi:hypothetical protein
MILLALSYRQLAQCVVLALAIGYLLYVLCSRCSILALGWVSYSLSIGHAFS